jgi:hypothetical protein
VRYRTTSAYILDLQRRVAESQSQPSQSQNLRQRVLTWHSSLPAVSRDRPFAMSEFEAALKTQGKYISPVLLELGWTRKRRWASGGGQYNRYWMPPTRSA